MRIELGVIIAFIIGELLTIFNIPGGIQILTYSLLLLAALYFALSVIVLKPKGLARKGDGFAALSGLLIFLFPLGVLFRLNFWVGGQLILFLCCFSLPIILIISIFKMKKSKTELYKLYQTMMIRSAIFLVISLVLYNTSAYPLIEIQYYGDPHSGAEHLHYLKQLDSLNQISLLK